MEPKQKNKNAFHYLILVFLVFYILKKIIKRINKENIQLKNQIIQLKNQIDGLNGKIIVLIMENEKKDSQINFLKTTININKVESDKKIEKLEKEIQQLKDAMNKKNDE